MDGLLRGLPSPQLLWDKGDPSWQPDFSDVACRISFSDAISAGVTTVMNGLNTTFDVNTGHVVEGDGPWDTQSSTYVIIPEAGRYWIYAQGGSSVSHVSSRLVLWLHHDATPNGGSDVSLNQIEDYGDRTWSRSGGVIDAQAGDRIYIRLFYTSAETINGYINAFKIGGQQGADGVDISWGSSFPPNPSSNQLFRRTDIQGGMLFEHWAGPWWISQPQLVPQTSYPSGSELTYSYLPVGGDFEGVYVMDMEIVQYSTTVDASNYVQFRASKRTPANADTALLDVNTNGLGHAAATIVADSQAVGQIVWASTHPIIRLITNPVGTPSSFGSCGLWCRWIAV